MKGLNDMKGILETCALIFLAASSCAGAATCKTDKSSCPPHAQRFTHDASRTTHHDPRTDPNKIDDILTRLQAQTSQLKSYQAEIHYLFIQDPESLDSRTLRKGTLYYKKDESGSKLRVSFNTLKQDDGDEEKYIEHFIFDGVWLTKIDFQLEKVDFYQQAPEDQPIDVFEFISHRFPLLGFTKIPHLRNQFHLTLIPPKEAKSNDFIGLRLSPKEDSIYKDDYATISFWVDNESFLTVKLAAKSTEGDISDIQLLDIKANKKIENAVFKLETPNHFSQNRAPLNRK